MVWTIPVDGGSEKELRYSPDGKRLASSYGRAGEVRIRDAATGKLLQTLRGHKDAVTCLAFSPDGNRLATGGLDTAVKIWSLADSRELAVYHGQTGSVNTVAFAPDGKTLASADANGSLRIWDATTDPGTRTLPTGEHAPFVTVVSHDGKQFAMLRPRSFSVNLAVAESATGRVIHSLRTFAAFQGFMADIKFGFSPVGATLGSTDGRNLVQLWDLTTGRERLSLPGHTQQVTALAFSPDGATLATADKAKLIKLWDVASGREARSLVSEFSPLALAYSPDGHRLAVTGHGEIRIEKLGENRQRPVLPGKGVVWDLASGRVLYALPDHRMQTVAVAFSSDGSKLATASWDGTAKLIEASSHQEIYELGGHTGYVTDVAFSPNGRRLVTCGTDETIKLWDVATGQEVLELSDGRIVERIDFSPDGGQIVARGQGRVKLWISSREGGPPAVTGN